jgi:hypothetical protein
MAYRQISIQRPVSITRQYFLENGLDVQDLPDLDLCWIGCRLFLELQQRITEASFKVDIYRLTTGDCTEHLWIELFSNIA